jgi:hypothetical protein
VTLEETVRLLGVVAAGCPAMRLEPGTSRVWHQLLDDLELGDCLEAFRVVARRQPFVAPADLRAEVKATRQARMLATPDPVPAADPDDAAAYFAELRANRRAIAGTPAPVERRAIGGA